MRAAALSQALPELGGWKQESPLRPHHLCLLDEEENWLSSWGAWCLGPMLWNGFPGAHTYTHSQSLGPTCILASLYLPQHRGGQLLIKMPKDQVKFANIYSFNDGFCVTAMSDWPTPSTCKSTSLVIISSMETAVLRGRCLSWNNCHPGVFIQLSFYSRNNSPGFTGQLRGLNGECSNI